MSKPIDDGGAAFPRSGVHSPGEGILGALRGMSLRDYFAAAALPVVSPPYDIPVDLRSMARQAYEFADALLAARAESMSGGGSNAPLNERKS